jgi:hypothetical protein
VPAGAPATTAPATTPDAAAGIEYHVVLPPFGLTPPELDMLFSPSAGVLSAQAVQNNRDFGVAALVAATFTLGSERASVLKRIVYWPNLPVTPAVTPNQNPRLDAIQFFRDRDPDTGDPIGMWTDTPVVSIAAKDKLFVLPVPAADAVETYALRVRNATTGAVETRTVQELLVFDFFTKDGKFSPTVRQNTPPVFADPGAPIHLDSELKLELLPGHMVPVEGQKTDIWVVVRDERAGVSWSHATVMIVP